MNFVKVLTAEENLTHSVKDTLKTLLIKLILVFVPRFNVDVIANAKLALNLIWCVEADDATMGHNANSVGKFVCLLDMLSAHDNRSSFF